MSKIELDKTDRKILAILQQDGRMSNQDVADQVSLSPSPCLRRIKRLEEGGVIRQYVALLDAAQIGLGLLAYVNVRLEKHSEGSSNAAGARRAAPGCAPRGGERGVTTRSLRRTSATWRQACWYTVVAYAWRSAHQPSR